MSAPLARDLTDSTVDTCDMDASFSSSSMTMSMTMSMSTCPSSITPSTGDAEEQKLEFGYETFDEHEHEHTPQGALRRFSPTSPSNFDFDFDYPEVSSEDQVDDDGVGGRDQDRPVLRRVAACLALSDLAVQSVAVESAMKGKRNFACPNLEAMKIAAEDQARRERDERERERQLDEESIVFIRPRSQACGSVRSNKRAVSVDSDSDPNLVCFAITKVGKARISTRTSGNSAWSASKVATSSMMVSSTSLPVQSVGQST